MLKACQYCGRVHNKHHTCSAKRKTLAERNAAQRERDERIRKFRDSGAWKCKVKAIRSRDKDCCLVCKHEMSKTLTCTGTLTGTEVHHITPLAEDFELRLEDENLITLCRDHHEQAECGDLKADYLRQLVTAAESTD